jgi:hypothetical protein
VKWIGQGRRFLEKRLQELSEKVKIAIKLRAPVCPVFATDKLQSVETTNQPIENEIPDADDSPSLSTLNPGCGKGRRRFRTSERGFG